MATIKIASLPSVTSIEDTDLLILDQADSTRKMPLKMVKDSSVDATLTILNAPTGASELYSKNAPVSVLIRRSIFEYLSKEDRENISTTLGLEIVVDYALQAAINDGVMELHFPPVKGIYVLGQTPVTLPTGFAMTGVASKPYTATTNTSFNNRGTVLRLFNGATSLFILTNRHRFFNIIFDGRDKSVNLMKGVGSDQTQYCRFDSCGVYRWLNGFGGSSSSGYTATLQLIGCAIASNYRGIRNLIDSRITDCNINANDTAGVELNAGANNNSFVNVRNEWNGTYNWFCSGGKRNIVIGELCDRAGTNAFAAVNGGQWIVNGVTVQRSGKNAVSGTTDDAHFYIAGAGSVLILNGVYTLVGVNDDGSGNSTPSYILASDSSGTDDKTFIAAGSKLDGYSSTSYIRPGSAIAKTSILGCIGVQDTVNTGFHQIRNGRWHLGDSVRNVTLPAGVGSTVSMTFPAIDSDFAQYSVGFSRSIEIMGRNGATGSESRFFCKMMIKRESATATINPDTQRVESQVDLSGGSWGLSSATPTGVSVAFSISSDASIITVTLTNIDGAARVVSAELLP